MSGRKVVSGRPWYPHYMADYARDTAHLTMLQHGAYRLLLDHCYATAKPLPANAELLHRICRANSNDEIDAVDFVVQQFFVRRRDGLHHKRVDLELARADAISEKRGNAAKIRHRRAKNKSNANALHLDTQSQSHTQSQEKNPPILPPKGAKVRSENLLNGSQKEFDEWWQAYPRKQGKGQAERAYLKALSLVSPNILLDGARRYATVRAGEDQQYTRLPATWLNGKCWLDETSQGPPAVDPTIAKLRELESQKTE